MKGVTGMNGSTHISLSHVGKNDDINEEYSMIEWWCGGRE